MQEDLGDVLLRGGQGARAGRLVIREIQNLRASSNCVRVIVSILGSERKKKDQCSVVYV